ncbi:MAG: biopolymer transporter ExbD [Planctomycetota bacterium]
MMPGRRSHVSGFDLTPMIDVVLLLIIFFLVSAQISRSIRQPIDLPNQAGAEETINDGDSALIVDLLSDGSLRVESETVDMPTLLAMLRDAGLPRPEILIRPAFDARASALNDLTRQLTESGTTSYRIATDPAGRGGG